jgi:glutathione S-transferase
VTISEVLLVDLQAAPACAKVRACLQLKAVPFRRTPATLGLMRRVQRRTPEAEPPVLALGDETVVGAGAIVDWLEATVPTPALLPADAAARGYCRMLEQWADHVLGGLVDAVVWRDPAIAQATARILATEMAPGPLAWPAARWVRRHAARRRACPAHEVRPRLAVALAVVEDSLGERSFLLGDALTIADVALYVQLTRLAAVATPGDVPPLGPATSSWRARLDAVDALRTAIAP